MNFFLRKDKTQLQGRIKMHTVVQCKATRRRFVLPVGERKLDLIKKIKDAHIWKCIDRRNLWLDKLKEGTPMSTDLSARLGDDATAALLRKEHEHHMNKTSTPHVKASHRLHRKQTTRAFLSAENITVEIEQRLEHIPSICCFSVL